MRKENTPRSKGIGASSLLVLTDMILSVQKVPGLDHDTHTALFQRLPVRMRYIPKMDLSYYTAGSPEDGSFPKGHSRLPALAGA